MTPTGKVRTKEGKVLCYGDLFLDFGESNIYMIMHKTSGTVRPLYGTGISLLAGERFLYI